jgi:CheY-like chemotaxis protein
VQFILSPVHDRTEWKLACTVEVDGEITMSLQTILYIPDKAISNDAVSDALKSTGYEVVSADKPSQGIVMLFLMRSVAAVVLHEQAGVRTGNEMARTLRAIRPDVPIILLYRDRMDHLPSCVDVCVNLARTLDMLTSSVRWLLTAVPAACARDTCCRSCAAA